MTILGAVFALGCGEPLSPNDVAGTYALGRVAGDSLPAVLYTTETWRIRIFADTLLFTSDGRGTIVTVRELEPLTGGASPRPRRGGSGFGFLGTFLRRGGGF